MRSIFEESDDRDSEVQILGPGDDGTLTIKPGLKFGYTAYKEFTTAYQQVNINRPLDIIIDMSITRQIDSMGIGMLFNLYSAWKGKDCHFSIINIQPQVLRILKLSRMDKQFDLITQ